MLSWHAAPGAMQLSGMMSWHRSNTALAGLSMLYSSESAEVWGSLALLQCNQLRAAWAAKLDAVVGADRSSTAASTADLAAYDNVAVGTAASCHCRS